MAWHAMASHRIDSSRVISHIPQKTGRSRPSSSAVVISRCSSMPDAHGRLAASEEGGTLFIIDTSRYVWDG